MTARSKSTGSRPTTLVISNIAWDFVWQRHQTLASLFARDSEVVFLEVPGIRRVRLRDEKKSPYGLLWAQAERDWFAKC